MHRLISSLALVLASCVWLLPATVLAQCNDIMFLDGFEAPEDRNWPVAVAVSMLGNNDPGRSITLTLNGADPLAISADGVFCFNDTTPGASTYTVQIIEQPAAGDVCSLDNDAGIATGPVLVQAICDTPPTLWDQFDWDAANWN